MACSRCAVSIGSPVGLPCQVGLLEVPIVDLTYVPVLVDSRVNVYIISIGPSPGLSN